MVHIHGHRASTKFSTSPRETILTNMRGSNPSIPETGQELAHRPQVTQKSWKNGQVLHLV
jgi:hypothetical protein